MLVRSRVWFTLWSELYGIQLKLNSKMEVLAGLTSPEASQMATAGLLPSQVSPRILVPGSLSFLIRTPVLLNPSPRAFPNGLFRDPPLHMVALSGTRDLESHLWMVGHCSTPYTKQTDLVLSQLQRQPQPLPCSSLQDVETLFWGFVAMSRTRHRVREQQQKQSKTNK